MPRNLNKIDYSGGFPTFFTSFEILEDPRTGGNTKHHFGEVIFMVFTSMICGVTTYELMEEFCHANENWFKKWLTLPNGIPCDNTFSRIFELINPEVFSSCIMAHLKLVKHDFKGEQIAIDGKSLRGSTDRENKNIHAVSAWACESGVTLAQTFVDKKSNEITAIPKLLELLNIEGHVVTIDAMGTQVAIAETIIDKGGDYILSVKENQKSLYDEIDSQFHFARTQLQGEKLDPKRWSVDEVLEKSKGRIETRQTLVCHDLSWMSSEVKQRWKGLESVILVYRHVETKNGAQSHQLSYYMSSLKDQRAAELQQYIRQHWSIENNCHWVIDTVMKEDAHQLKKQTGAKNLSSMRRIVLNTLKLAPDKSRRKKPASFTKKQLWAAQDLDYREHCISLV